MILRHVDLQLSATRSLRLSLFSFLFLFSFSSHSTVTSTNFGLSTPAGPPWSLHCTLRCGTRELRWYVYCRCHTYCGCDCKSPMSDLSAVPHAGLPNEGFSGMHPRESMLRTPKHLNRLRYRQNSPHQGSGSLLMASIASLISLADGGQTA